MAKDLMSLVVEAVAAPSVERDQSGNYELRWTTEGAVVIVEMAPDLLQELIARAMVAQVPA